MDTFFFEALNQQKTYEGLWCIKQLLLTLSHGQAAVERGFSVNKDVLAPNFEVLNLTALCLIHDSVSAGQIGIADYIITLSSLHLAVMQEKSGKGKLFKKS